MEMILNEYDMVVGASFENGTIQDYVDENKTYGLIRVDETVANWFLYNKEDSTPDIQALYSKVLLTEHFIQDDFGEEIVVFDKKGDLPFEELVKKIDAYMGDELGSII